MDKKRQKSWLRLRGYLHFSKRFNSSKDANRASKHFIKHYVKDENKVCRHAFSPFLHYSIKESRFRRPYSKENLEKEYLKKEDFRRYDKKDRPIYFSNHLDAQIFAFYAHKISESLEKEYTKNTFFTLHH